MSERFNQNRAAILIAVVACLLGLGAAGTAYAAVSSAAPDDAKAATTGPNDTVKPDQIISYGG